MPELKKVLVIDDEDGVIKVITAHLSADGYHVQGASAADEALKLFEENRFDLVLLDIRLSGENGLDVLKQIKQIDETVPVFMVTGVYDNDEAQSAFQAGAVEYITKPIDFYYLKNALQNQLG